MNWIQSMLNNSPSPAFQLPYYVPKELFVPEVIKELSQNSRPTPLALNKGIPAPVDKQTSLANASAARQKIFDNSGRKPIPQFPISSPLVLPDVTVVGKKTTKDPAATSRKEGLRKAFHPEEFVKKSSYNNKGKSAAEVIELQRRLGVTADGKWGEKTQKAYESSMLDQKAKDADLGPIKTKSGYIKSDKPKLASNWTPPDYKQKGGKIEEKKKGGKNWIQGAVNPEHKGYCTPMTKETCTPKRKAFAMTMKKHHGFHKKENGGILTPIDSIIEAYQKGGTLKATQDSTKYYSNKLKSNIEEHFNAKNSFEKDEAAKKATQSKANLARQANKNKVGFNKDGFPIKKQNGGEMPKGGDQAAMYKKGKDVKVPQKGKIDASKWKK